MKKLLLICIVLSLVLFMVTISSAGSNKAETVNGYVSDSQCGVKGASADQAECTKKCVAKGAKLVVVTDGDQKILAVDNPDKLQGHEGHHVAVTGKVKGDSIHIDDVKML